MELDRLNVHRNTEVLIAAMVEKLRANDAVVPQAHRGHISWRWDKGKLEITFKPEL